MLQEVNYPSGYPAFHIMCQATVALSLPATLLLLTHKGLPFTYGGL